MFYVLVIAPNILVSLQTWRLAPTFLFAFKSSRDIKKTLINLTLLVESNRAVFQLVFTARFPSLITCGYATRFRDFAARLKYSFFISFLNSQNKYSILFSALSKATQIKICSDIQCVIPTTIKIFHSVMSQMV